MNSELITKWTAIFTNLAVVLGLIFVALEFRSNTRAIEADRIDSFIGGAAESDSIIIENADFAEIIVKSYANPESLTDGEVVRLEHFMLTHADNFKRVLHAYKAGLLPKATYETQRAGVGFIFVSDPGLKLIKIFRASNLDDEAWEILSESATEARSYCREPQNTCLDRYDMLQVPEL